MPWIQTLLNRIPQRSSSCIEVVYVPSEAAEASQ
jgi:hypothetical protein